MDGQWMHLTLRHFTSRNEWRLALGWDSPGIELLLRRSHDGWVGGYLDVKLRDCGSPSQELDLAFQFEAQRRDGRWVSSHRFQQQWKADGLGGVDCLFQLQGGKFEESNSGASVAPESEDATSALLSPSGTLRLRIRVEWVNRRSRSADIARRLWDSRATTHDACFLSCDRTLLPFHSFVVDGDSDQLREALTNLTGVGEASLKIVESKETTLEVAATKETDYLQPLSMEDQSPTKHTGLTAATPPVVPSPFSASLLQIALTALYGVSDSFPPRTAGPLFELADFYGLAQLKQQARAALLAAMRDRFIEPFEISVTSPDPVLLRETREFIAKDPVGVLRTITNSESYKLFVSTAPPERAAKIVVTLLGLATDVPPPLLSTEREQDE